MQKRGKTAYQKIVDAHLLKTLPDGTMVLKVDQVFCHEITTPPGIVDMKARGCDVVFDPNRIKATIDHVCPSNDEATAFQADTLRKWCKEHGIEFRDAGQGGVCHALFPESGWLFPGQIAVMGDSHTCTGGAFGALTAGVGTSEMMAAVSTELWFCQPQRVIRVEYVGTLPANVFAKDLILMLIEVMGVAGATNAVIEFGGPVVEALSMEARMTMTNMVVEAGATSGMVAVDDKTIEYLRPLIESAGYEEEELLAWNSDPNAEYNQVITIDVTDRQPLITVEYTPADVVPASDLEGMPFQQVFIGSCTNGRLEDLRIAAGIMRDFGGRIADGTRCIVIPATQHIYRRALYEGLIDVFMAAGCVVMSATCGPCLGMSGGVLAPGEVCISTSNRNFKGRMGKGGMVHLCSPAVAALSAMTGSVAVPSPELCGRVLDDIASMSEEGHPLNLTDWDGVTELSRPDYGVLHRATRITVKPEFSGKVLYLQGKRGDNVDTDVIIPAKYLTTSVKTGLGQHCLEGVDLTGEEQERLFRSSVLVAGKNFGCGSSREHAPWSLFEAGITCVIASSFARIFSASMFANGLLCVELPDEVMNDLRERRPDTVEVLPDEGVVRVGTAGEDMWEIPFKLTWLQKELLRKGGVIPFMFETAAGLQAEGKL
ncbi:MAG: 3-isopropylmalate dehydratase large subunit [Candidatus Moranbacteria bacterium]|nr:3-isopropylmalate dehydratase large subunit [Candidatus Moranbacteria bacterium]